MLLPLQFTLTDETRYQKQRKTNKTQLTPWRKKFLSLFHMHSVSHFFKLSTSFIIKFWLPLDSEIQEIKVDTINTAKIFEWNHQKICKKLKKKFLHLIKFISNSQRVYLSENIKILHYEISVSRIIFRRLWQVEF